MTVGSSKTMQAWVVSQPGPIETGPLRYVEKPVPAPAPGELLVQVLACAVCRTDLHVSEGDLPVHREHVTPGHMVVGPVAALGDGVTGYAVGDRVGVAWLRYTDGTCVYCRRGNENLCPNSLYTGWDADGGYAEYTTVPAAFAYRLRPTSLTSSWRRCCAPGSSATGRCCAHHCRPAAGSDCTDSATAPTWSPRWRWRKVRLSMP